MRRSPHKLAIDLCARIREVLGVSFVPSSDVVCLDYNSLTRTAHFQFLNPLSIPLYAGVLVDVDILDQLRVLPPNIREEVEHHLFMGRVFQEAKTIEPIHDATALDGLEARTFGIRAPDREDLEVRLSEVREILRGPLGRALSILGKLVENIFKNFIGLKLTVETMRQLHRALTIELKYPGFVDEIDMTWSPNCRSFDITARAGSNILTIPGKL